MESKIYCLRKEKNKIKHHIKNTKYNSQSSKLLNKYYRVHEVYLFDRRKVKKQQK